MITAKCLLAMASLVLATSTAEPVYAQEFPSKTIRLVVPFPPGGTGDIVGRLTALELSRILGQQVVVDNRAGAAGNIGSDQVARAAPDGYTLLVGTTGTHAINATLYPKLPYDPLKDFAPISLLAKVANVLVVHPSVPARSVQELFALAKQRPGGLTYASGGSGTTNHLSAQLFISETGIKLVHIPYKGTPGAIVDLIAGRVDLMFDNLTTALQNIKNNRVRPLMITSAARNAQIPDVPTVYDEGLKNCESGVWYGLFAPAGTPENVIATLNKAVVTFANSPELKKRYAAQGTDLVAMSPKEFEEYLKREIQKWKKVVEASGARIE